MCDPVIPLLGIYPGELETDVHTGVYVNVNGHRRPEVERPSAEERTECGLSSQWTVSRP